MNYGAKKEKLSGQRGVGEGGLELPAERFGDCNLIFFSTSRGECIGPFRVCKDGGKDGKRLLKEVE